MAPPLIIRVIGDITSALKANETLVSSNTVVGDSALAMGGDYAKASAVMVDAIEKSITAQKAQIAANQVAMKSLSGDTLLAMQTRTTAMQERLNRQLGVTPVALGRVSKETQVAERDLGKLTRGALAGSGVFSKLGRSLAFASGSFLAIAGGATVLHMTISAAEDLAAAQRTVNQQLETGGKSWSQYGARISAANDKLRAVSGFSDQELLQSFGFLFRASNNVGTSLKFQAVAADVARARNISLASASIALSKALGGSLTALKRLGITVPANLKGMDALNFVMQKFTGQAQAGTTGSERFSAELQHTAATVGTILLPTFERLVTKLGDWLTKLNRGGQLQKAVSDDAAKLGHVFHTLEAVIHDVDAVTGSLYNTFKLLFELWLGFKVVGIIRGLDLMVGGWLAVESAANAATAAEERALAVGAGGAAMPGAAGVGIAGGLASRRAAAAEEQATRSAALRGRIGAYTGAAGAGEATLAEEGVAAIGGAAVASTAKVGALRGALSGLSGLTLAAITIPIIVSLGNRAANALSGTGEAGRIVSDLLLRPAIFHPQRAMQDFGEIFGGPSPAQIAANQRQQDIITARLSRGQFGPPAPFAVGGNLQRGVTGQPSQYPFGVPPIPVWTAYANTIGQQIAQVRASMTKSLADDAAVAKQIIARIKHLIEIGHLVPGTKGYLSALQEWASAQATLDSAEQQAAAQRAAAAAKAKQIASSYSTPLGLQIAEVQAQMTKSTADDLKVERQILAAAKAALAAGGKNKQGRLAILQVMLQAQQAIQQLQQQGSAAFVEPMRLQIALAREGALGQSTTSTLLKMKRAAMKAIESGKYTGQALIDLWNQIAQINQQLGSSAQAALGLFKQKSVKALTAGLHLTAAQRRELEARLAQRGPGGTYPGSGVGAGGFAIDPTTGRPISVGRHRHHSSRRIPSSYSGDGGGPAFSPQFVVNVTLDGKQIASDVTIYQQRHRRHNPSQRRGPNSATPAA